MCLVKLKELSPILTARGASYRMKGKIYKACVQSVSTYGTETWAMKKAYLQSLERMEQMMVRWMCRVSLKETQCGFVQTSRCTECGRCGEAWQVEVVWASEE